MCENGGECCIAKHLGCNLNPSLSHLYEGFLTNCQIYDCKPEPEDESPRPPEGF